MRLAILTLLVTFAADAHTQTAYFDEATDTIRLDAHTLLGPTATFEAVVFFPSEGGVGGAVFSEWTSAVEDKQFPIYFSPTGPSFLVGYVYPRPGGAFQAEVELRADTWHHVAYVIDTVEERLYLDGTLVDARAMSGTAGNGDGTGWIGAVPRDGAVLNSFRGYLDSFRISTTARYSGASFPPPSGDLPSDGDTVVLFTFNEPAGSATVHDAGPSGFTGTLGVGFDGATPPSLGAMPVAAEPAPVSPLALAAAPNPASGAVRVRYTLDAPEAVRLAVVDALGREVATLARGPRPAGEHEATLDASALPAGVYVVRLEASGAVQTVTVVR